MFRGWHANPVGVMLGDSSNCTLILRRVNVGHGGMLHERRLLELYFASYEEVEVAVDAHLLFRAELIRRLIDSYWHSVAATPRDLSL